VNLAKKMISNLEAQLAGQLSKDKKADIKIINNHAEQALNIILE